MRALLPLLLLAVLFLGLARLYERRPVWARIGEEPK